MTESELYDIYSKWTGELHFFAIRDLGRHLDCEYFPATYEFKVYSGYAEDSLSGTVPGLSRPEAERSETIRLLKPADDPTQEQLTELFKTLCLAAARVLEIPINRAALEDIPWTGKKRRTLERTADGIPGLLS